MFETKRGSQCLGGIKIFGRDLSGWGWNRRGCGLGECWEAILQEAVLGVRLGHSSHSDDSSDGASSLFIYCTFSKGNILAGVTASPACCHFFPLSKELAPSGCRRSNPTSALAFSGYCRVTSVSVQSYDQIVTACKLPGGRFFFFFLVAERRSQIGVRILDKILCERE